MVAALFLILSCDSRFFFFLFATPMPLFCAVQISFAAGRIGH
jgi:hypothetical protein